MKKLDENPDLLEAFAKRSLDDPDFFAAVQKGDLSKLDELAVVNKLTSIIVKGISNAKKHYSEHVLGKKLDGTPIPKKKNYDIEQFPTQASFEKYITDFFKRTHDDMLEHISKEGTIFRYDKLTGEIGIIGKDGIIQTVFKPDAGLNYFNNQILNYP